MPNPSHQEGQTLIEYLLIIILIVVIVLVIVRLLGPAADNFINSLFSNPVQ